MNTKAVSESAPDRLEKLLADLESKYQKPDPDNIALGAHRFEQVLATIVVPFLGINAFLISGISLQRLYPDQRFTLAACNLCAAAILVVWTYYRRSPLQTLPAMFSSAVPTFLLAAVFAFPVPLVVLPLSLLVTYIFAALVYRSKIPQAAVPIFVVYIPILLVQLQGDQPFRIAEEFLMLVPMGILFIRRKFRVATSAVVIAAVITAGAESSDNGAKVAAIALLFVLVCFAIWYEVSIPKTDYSGVRALLDQSLLVLLSYWALYAIGFHSQDRLTWIWALAVAAYEGIQCGREKLIYPTRIAVAGVALTIALWSTDKPLPSSIPIAGALAIAALLNVAGLRLKNTLLSTIGFLLVIPGALKVYDLGDSRFSATAIVFGLLTSISVLLVARRPGFDGGRPWWHGFVQQNHLDWAKNALLMVAGTLLKIPFATFVFNIFRSAFHWLRFFKGKGEPFGLTDILYSAAHAYGAFILSRQLQLWIAVRNGSENTQLTFATGVWVVWGLVIFSIGLRNRTIYQRFVGLSFLIVPWVLYFPAINANDEPLALVSMIAGTAFWVVGVLSELRGRISKAEEATEEEAGGVEAVAAEGSTT